MSGDVDGDGALSASDALLMRKFLARAITEDSIIIGGADLNEDGIVNAKDMILLRKALVK